MNVKFIQLTAAKWAATYNAAKYQGLFVHLTENVLKGGDGDDKNDVVTPAGLYFGGVSGWEMLSNDTDVAAIKKAIEDAIEALDTTADVVTASVADGVVTLTAGIAQEDGKIKKGASTDITLAKVATTGKAVDITFDAAPADGEKAGSKIAAGATLQAVMVGVIDSINKSNEDAVVALYDKDDNALTGDAATVKADGTTYTLKQGTGADATVVAKFNIVKDSFVKSGSIVYGTLTDGTFTEATAAKDGSNAYIKLEFATNNGSGTKEDSTDVVYIPAASLVEYSSVATGDLYLSSSEDHVISVTEKVTKAITKVEGLTVNGQTVTDDGTVTIGAADIEYKAATTGENETDAVSVKDALDNLAGDAYQGVENANADQYVKVSDIADNKQTLSVTIGSFTVNEVKDEQGNVTTAAAEQVKGLATVEAVEAVILENEQVTATALNDLNDRVEDLEAKELTWLTELPA